MAKNKSKKKVVNKADKPTNETTKPVIKTEQEAVKVEKDVEVKLADGLLIGEDLPEIPKEVLKEEEGKVSKAESIKPFSELTTIACRQEWEKRMLVEFVQETYKDCEIKVDEFNSRQICFHIDGIKVPKDGYFSVK